MAATPCVPTAREMHPQSSEGDQGGIPQKRRLATAWVRIRPLSEMGFAAAGISPLVNLMAVARVNRRRIQWRIVHSGANINVDGPAPPRTWAG